MTISAALVKELRERTGSGMMECKKALVEADGDIEKAVEIMRKAGLAKADKKAGRVAAEGIIEMLIAPDGRRGVLVEVNCETDFVGKGDDFRGFANGVAKIVMSKRPANVEELTNLSLTSDETVGTARQRLVAKLGENIQVRRFADIGSSKGRVAGYLHGTRIGVLVEVEGGSEELAKDIAMHVAASRPVCVSPQEVPADVVEKEREIYMAQAADSGKPKDIIEKMVAGRVSKYLKEVTLLGQPFVKDPDTTVEKLLAKNSAKVVRFARFEVGEGIEKQTGNFAEEVMQQVRGS